MEVHDPGPLHYNVLQDELAEKGAGEEVGFQRDIRYVPFLIYGASEVTWWLFFNKAP